MRGQGHAGQSNSRTPLDLKKALLITALISILGIETHAQNTDFGTWSYTTVSKPLGEKWGAMVRLEHRTKNNAGDLDCALIMPGISYKPVSWMTLGFIYDYAITTSANRQVLLPYIQFAKTYGHFALSFREMGQYIIDPSNLLMRTKMQLQYKIDNSRITPSIFIEPYTHELSLSRLSAFVGANIKVGSRSSLEGGYTLYYLSASDTYRNILSIGYTVRI